MLKQERVTAKLRYRSIERMSSVKINSAWQLVAWGFICICCQKWKFRMEPIELGSERKQCGWLLRSNLKLPESSFEHMTDRLYIL